MLTPARPARTYGFTLAELLVAAAVFGVVSTMLLVFTSALSRLVVRNLATNHSHSTARVSAMSLLSHLQESGSRFQLIEPNGSNYDEVTPNPTADKDPLTGSIISDRAAGVRFRRLAGGPYELVSTTTTSSTDLQFKFRRNTNDGVFIPIVGDKVYFPLFKSEFEIAAVPIVPSTSNEVGTITISSKIGVNIDATDPKITVGYFYRRAAFVVVSEELRYFADFQDAKVKDYVVVRNNVTSPHPFSLLLPSGGSGVSEEAGQQVRISLESYETKKSAIRMLGSATTLQTVIPLRNLPSALSSTQ